MTIFSNITAPDTDLIRRTVCALVVDSRVGTLSKWSRYPFVKSCPAISNTRRVNKCTDYVSSFYSVNDSGAYILFVEIRIAALFRAEHCDAGATRTVSVSSSSHLSSSQLTVAAAAAVVTVAMTTSRHVTAVSQSRVAVDEQGSAGIQTARRQDAGDEMT